MKTYFWVRLGDNAEYERFDTFEEAKDYIEEITGENFEKAKQVNEYGFELGDFTGYNYISLFKGDENGEVIEK